jgi:hypothetical protein
MRGNWSNPIHLDKGHLARLLAFLEPRIQTKQLIRPTKNKDSNGSKDARIEHHPHLPLPPPQLPN